MVVKAGSGSCDDTGVEYGGEGSVGTGKADRGEASCTPELCILRSAFTIARSQLEFWISRSGGKAAGGEVPCTYM